MLAYNLTESETSIPKSELILQGVSIADFNIFKTALRSFYHPENELLGEKIWENSDGAVYTRSKEQYDNKLPYNYNYGRKGIVFCGYQLRGSNPFDLVVCLHDFEQNDRERDSLLDMEVVTVFKMYLYPTLSKIQMNWRQEARSWYKKVHDKSQSNLSRNGYSL